VDDLGVDLRPLYQRFPPKIRLIEWWGKEGWEVKHPPGGDQRLTD
jgi:hypothetical protein